MHTDDNGIANDNGLAELSDTAPTTDAAACGTCELVLEPQRPLIIAQRVTALRAALAAAPQITALRGKLVDHLINLGRFDDALVLIAQWPDGGNSYDAQMALATVSLVPKTRACDSAARVAAHRASELELKPRRRAAALALRGKAERRLGDAAAAHVTLATALDLDPANIDACKRLAALLIARDDAASAIALTSTLLAQGVAHPQVLNARAVAQARLGLIDAARETVGFDQFGYRAKLEPPADFSDIEAFNALVARELIAHPARRRDPHGSASRETVRVDAPTSGQAPFATMLMEQITSALSDYINTMLPDPHPWRRARPLRGIVHGTCAITGPDGYETWHIHQQGWLSGVYYVSVPNAVTDGASPDGCIAFGLDDAFAGAEVAIAYGQNVIRPTAGMLMLFPSHCYHRTFPHHSDDRRICMAFDVWPR